MERNWQEDWNWVTNVNHTPTETEIIAAYWLQEVKRLNEALEGIMRLTDGHGAYTTEARVYYAAKTARYGSNKQ